MTKPIFCIGEALIDMICTDRGQSLREGEHYLRKAGGAPTNVAAAIAALGGNVHLAGKIGNDPFGEHIAELVESFGVDTQWLLRTSKAFTTFAFVSLMPNGERDFFFNRGADALLNVHELEKLDVRQYSIAHFGSATAFLPGPLQDTYLQTWEQCRQSGLFLSFDPNYRHLLYRDRQADFIRQSWHFLKTCHFFKLSDEEAQLLTGQKDVKHAADQLLRDCNAVFAITIGKEGALVGCNGQLRTVPAIPVVPVDTTGAGDAFVGALLFQLQQQQIPANDVEAWCRIVANANRAGARTCEFMGAMEAFRHLNKSILTA